MEMKRLLPALLLVAGVSARAADRILILRAEGVNFQETTRSLEHELGPEFQCEDRVLGSGMDAGVLSVAIAKSRPKALVLMDNDAIKLYAEVQKQWRDSVPYPPSISLMAIRVDKAISGLQRATGIFYEVPGVTILVNLRSLVSEPVRRVGVIVRPSMEDFVRESAKWCKYENIELIPFSVPEDRKDVARAVRQGVRRLRDQEQVDALWILNDNFFLTPEIISGGWLPALERFRKPVLVGVENFVTARSRFGTFAILPDHYGLGVQAAGMILRLKEEEWELDGTGKVEQPLAVLKILNLEQARKSVHVKEAGLVEVDKVIR
ncbi:MAG: hypothetical protein JWO30_1435 [Fibrobacteres bacterium]|nr:hypothetical protein [Fibrobacterota bacterium]